MYQRILVATGGSLWSDAALTYAIALAAHTGAELRVLTVLASRGMYATPDGMDEAATNRASSPASNMRAA